MTTILGTNPYVSPSTTYTTAKVNADPMLDGTYAGYGF